MKKIVAMMLAMALVLCTACACAEGLAAAAERAKALAGKTVEAAVQAVENSNNQNSSAQTAAAPAGAAVAFGPSVVLDDPNFQIVRSTVYTDDQYSTEADVFFELKNVTDRVLMIDEMTIYAVNTSGERVDESKYVMAYPDCLQPGATSHVHEWIYDFIPAMSDLSHFEVVIELEDSFTKKQNMLDATWRIENGYLYVEVPNNTGDALFNVDVVAVVSDAQGKILAMDHTITGEYVGVTPGSTFVFRGRLPEYEKGVDFSGAVCDLRAYVEEYVY